MRASAARRRARLKPSFLQVREGPPGPAGTRGRLLARQQQLELALDLLHRDRTARQMRKRDQRIGEGMQGMPALERLTEGERESFTPSREQGFPSRGN